MRRLFAVLALCLVASGAGAQTARRVLLGGGRPLWSPAGAFGSSLVGYWDTTKSTITLNSTTISSISDLSTGGNSLVQASGASQPTYSATGLNGLPAAVFSGAQLIFIGTGAGFTVAQPNTVITLFATGAANPAFGTVWDGALSSSGNREIFFQRRSDTTDQATMYAGTLQGISGTQLSTSTPYLAALTFNGASSVYSLNGAALVTDNPGTFTISAGFIWGSGAIGATNAMQGALGLTMIVNRTLTTTEMQKAQGYAAWQFGLNHVVLPSNHPYYNAPPRL